MGENRISFSGKWVFLFIILFVTASWFVCSSFSPEIKTFKNVHNLSVKEWMWEEKKIVIKSEDPKINNIYKFITTSNCELKKKSPDDVIWTHKFGDNLHFLFTNIPLG